MSQVLHALSSALCHGGVDTLFCSRCLGVWAGAALALPLVPFAARRVPVLLWLLLGMFFLQMPVLGYGEVAIPPGLKTLSGQAFGLAVVFLLALSPARRWWRRQRNKSAGVPFLTIAAAGIVLLQALRLSGRAWAFSVMDGLSLAGLSGAAMLSIAWLAAVAWPGNRGRPG